MKHRDTNLLQQSYAAFELALQERPLEHFPAKWSNTTQYLAAVAYTLGFQNDDVAFLQKAESHYQSLLQHQDQFGPAMAADANRGLGNLYYHMSTLVAAEATQPLLRQAHSSWLAARQIYEAYDQIHSTQRLTELLAADAFEFIRREQAALP